jgi:hypothetical protein
MKNLLKVIKEKINKVFTTLFKSNETEGKYITFDSEPLYSTIFRMKCLKGRKVENGNKLKLSLEPKHFSDCVIPVGISKKDNYLDICVHGADKRNQNPCGELYLTKNLPIDVNHIPSIDNTVYKEDITIGLSGWFPCNLPSYEEIRNYSNVIDNISIISNSVMTLSNAMRILETDKLEESENYYISRDFGIYGSNLTFTYAKDKLVKPIFLRDDNYIKSMGLSWSGYAYCLFGEFWSSEKGTNCFTPKFQENAEDVLIMINWHKDLSNMENVGILKDTENIQTLNVLYFHRTKTSGALTGSDYIIVPKNYSRVKTDKDI